MARARSKDGRGAAAEHHRLLGSSLRMRILEALAAPHTARQVATMLGATPGNVHYHMQRLSTGGLIVQTGTRNVSGATEKYFRAASPKPEAAAAPAGGAVSSAHAVADGDLLARVSARITASRAEAQGLALALERALTDWQRETATAHGGDGLDVRLTVSIRDGAPKADA